MFKKIATEVYERVVKSYKSTLVGFGLAVGVVVVEQLGAYFAGLPTGWAPPLAAVFALVGAALRKKVAEYPQPPKPVDQV